MAQALCGSRRSVPTSTTTAARERRAREGDLGKGDSAGGIDQLGRPDRLAGVRQVLQQPLLAQLL
jgi:hypothetical protein